MGTNINSKKNIKNIFFSFDSILLFIGCLGVAIAVNMFLKPTGVAPGGISGFTIILNKVTSVPIWMLTLIVDLILFVFAFKFLSKDNCIKTILGASFYIICLKLTSSLSNSGITNDILLSTIYGGVLIGISQGLILRIDGTMAGTDLIGTILNKFFPSISIPKLMSFVDVIVIFLAAVINKNIEIGLYSGMSLFILMKVADTVVSGINYSKLFLIVSNEAPKINSEISSKINRGVTLIEAVGGFTSEKKDILMVVISKRQEVSLKRLILEIDPKAFITISNVTEVLGEGFKINKEA